MLGRLPYLLAAMFFLLVPAYVVFTDQYQGNLVANALQAIASLTALGWPGAFLIFGGISMLAIGLRHDDDALEGEGLRTEELPPV